jgi:hypothetical protein
MVTREHGERHVSYIPQKKPFPLPSNRRVGPQEVEVRVDSLPKLDGDIHATTHRRIHA